MSGFIGSPGAGSGGVAPWSAQSANKQLLAAEYAADLHVEGFGQAQDLYSFRTPWWPRSALDATGGEMIGDMMGSNACRDLPVLNSGAVAKVAFAGVSRDAYGSILVGCTVKLFKTADGSYPGSKDLKMDEVISDLTTGAFVLFSPWYPDTHYIVSYKAETPDVMGCSVNTLIGA